MKQVLVGTLALFAGAAVPLPAEAQMGVARGRVVDAEGRPVEGARVVLEFQGDLTRRYELVTNAKGEYMRVGVTPGRYHVSVSRDGYEPRGIATRVNIGPATDFPAIELLPVPEAPDPATDRPEPLKDKFGRAVELLRAGELDEAEALFAAILEVKREVPEVHQNLGYLYAQRREWDRAEASYRAALELKPEAKELMTSLAKVYQDSGQDEKAREMLRRAASADPSDARARFDLALALYEAGENPEARSAFEAALAADASMSEAHYYLGTILLGTGDAAQAIAHLESYLAESPADAPNAATARQLVEALKR